MWISVRKCLFRILWKLLPGGELNNSLQADRCSGLVKFLKTQIFFSISILPSIALKHLNFPDNLDFKGKNVAKFLLRSHFLSNNMTVKQYINNISRRHHATCIMGFFIPLTYVTLSQFYSITSLVLFTKNKKLWYEWKEDLLSIWLLQRITLYQKTSP